MKVAVLITGQLRFNNEQILKDFKKILTNFDIYISTYESFKREANYLTDKNNILYVDEKLQMQRHKYQWFHLNNLLKTFKNELLEYYSIIRLRTDIKTNLKIENLLNLNEKTFYIKSDWVFYAKTKHFYFCLENFYEELSTIYNIPKDTYIPINYENICLSDFVNSCVKWTFLTMPKSLHTYDYDRLKKIKIKTLSKEEKKFMEDCFKILLQNIRNKKFNSDKYVCSINKKNYFTSIKEFFTNIINKSIIMPLKFELNLDWDTRNLFR